MHHLAICLISLAAIAVTIALDLAGRTLPSAPLAAGLAVAVALIGVPHGGLDHLVGRRQLRPTLGRLWSPVFFTSYLAIAAVVAAGWLTFPLCTAITFFVLSAWHFGCDDELPDWVPSAMQPWACIAVGGLLIWIPAILRPAEFASILGKIVPSRFSLTADGIVQTLQPIAWVASFFAVSLVVVASLKRGGRDFAIRNILFLALFALCPILLSFGVYFVAWHSLRGLAYLRRTSGGTLREFVLLVAPISIAAVSLVLVGSWGWSTGGELSDEVVRSLFIGLSAMAVPHLLLHAWLPNQGDLLPSPTSTRTSGATA